MTDNIQERNKPKITRIAKLKGFSDIIAGRDFANVFKEGHVYSMYELQGVIMFKDLGEHALINKKYSGYKFSQIMMSGTHLLTKAEYKKEISEDEYLSENIDKYE